jgi:hypothetical protein
VASGRYQQAEFTADLDAVYRRPAEIDLDTLMSKIRERSQTNQK